MVGGSVVRWFGGVTGGYMYENLGFPAVPAGCRQFGTFLPRNERLWIYRLFSGEWMWCIHLKGVMNWLSRQKCSGDPSLLSRATPDELFIQDAMRALGRTRTRC